MTDHAKLIYAAEASLDGVTDRPWLYRPDKYRDWGDVCADGYRICQVVDPSKLDKDTLNHHRRMGIDPWEANARFVAASRQHVPDLIAALKASEARVAELEAENLAMKDAVLGSVSDRMVAAGMMSLDEAVSANALTRLNVHSGMTDLHFYEVWLERTAKKCIAMQAAHQTGENVLNDGLIDFVMGKAEMARSALENYRAALKGGDA